MTFIFTLEYPFHRANYGGGHQITRGLAVQLALLGHQVHVISTGYDEMGISAVDAGVKYHFTGRFYNYLGGLQIVAKSLSLIRRVKPDCVCCMTSEAAIIIPICNLLRVPAIFFLATPETPDFRFHSWKAFKNIRYKLGTFFQYIGASAANRVISLGDFINSQAHKNWGLPFSKLVPVGSGLDPLFLTPLPPGRKHVGVGGPSFLSVGRIAFAQKPLQMIAEALATISCPWQRWTIIGSGADELKLRARLIELGIAHKTVFLGTQDSSKVATLLDEHDITLLPSNFESFFITAYEAAARGKIIVTNNVADLRDYFVNSPSVIVVDGATVESYCKAIGYAVKEFEQLQSTVVETAEKTKSDYNWPVITGCFLQALKGTP